MSQIILMSNQTAVNSTQSAVFDNNISVQPRWSLYLRLIFAGLGIFSNLVNVLVFMNSRLQDVAYKYMMATSGVNFLFLSIHFVIVMLNLCIDCKSGTTYASALVSILLGYYLQNCLAVMRLFLEIMISLRIYFILLNKTFERVSYKIIILLLMVVSLVYYIQQPFSYMICQKKLADNSIAYGVQTTSFGNSALAKWLIVGQFSVRILLTMVVLSVINILSVIEFRGRTARVSCNQPTLSSIKDYQNEVAQSVENTNSLSKSKIEIKKQILYFI